MEGELIRVGREGNLAGGNGRTFIRGVEQALPYQRGDEVGTPLSDEIKISPYQGVMDNIKLT